MKEVVLEMLMDVITRLFCSGGVPAVDFSLKDKVKNALPGHHSSSTTGDDTVATTAGGLGTSNHATTGAGSLTGPGDATSFGSGQRATGADQSVERNLGSTSLAAAPATSAGAAAAAGTANNDLTGSSGLTGAHGAHQTPATGTASTATTGATHGISDTAERHLAEGEKVSLRSEKSLQTQSSEMKGIGEF